MRDVGRTQVEFVNHKRQASDLQIRLRFSESTALLGIQSFVSLFVKVIFEFDQCKLTNRQWIVELSMSLLLVKCKH